MTAARLVRNVQTKPAAQELLALGLGLSEFLPRDSRQRQVVSGTVHVFAISGMHLGMVALLLTVLLRWSALPLGLQRLLLALFSAGYALLTGASVSSLRALWMVWLGLYATSRHRRTSWLNALGCAAFFALAIQPWQVLDMGFLYSHLTVLVLLLGAPMMQRLAALLGERDAWLPRTMRQRRRLALLKWLAAGLAVSLLAWLGSLGMTLHHNARISYGAPLLNLPLGILVATTLALCPLRLLLGALFPAADGFWASALETMMQLTAAFAESGAGSAFAFDHPLLPLWAVILYYLLFFPCLIWLYLHFQKESE